MGSGAAGRVHRPRNEPEQLNNRPGTSDKAMSFSQFDWALPDKFHPAPSCASFFSLPHPSLIAIGFRVVLEAALYSPVPCLTCDPGCWPRIPPSGLSCFFLSLLPLLFSFSFSFPQSCGGVTTLCRAVKPSSIWIPSTEQRLSSIAISTTTKPPRPTPSRVSPGRTHISTLQPPPPSGPSYGSTTFEGSFQAPSPILPCRRSPPTPCPSP